MFLDIDKISFLKKLNWHVFRLKSHLGMIFLLLRYKRNRGTDFLCESTQNWNKKKKKIPILKKIRKQRTLEFRILVNPMGYPEFYPVPKEDALCLPLILVYEDSCFLFFVSLWGCYDNVIGVQCTLIGGGWIYQSLVVLQTFSPNNNHPAPFSVRGFNIFLAQ